MNCLIEVFENILRFNKNFLCESITRIKLAKNISNKIAKQKKNNRLFIPVKLKTKFK